MATSYRLSILFAGLALAAESLAVPVTGQSASLIVQLGGYSLSAGAGSVAVTGQTAALQVATLAYSWVPSAGGVAAIGYTSGTHPLGLDATRANATPVGKSWNPTPADVGPWGGGTAGARMHTWASHSNFCGFCFAESTQQLIIYGGGHATVCVPAPLAFTLSTLAWEWLTTPPPSDALSSGGDTVAGQTATYPSTQYDPEWGEWKGDYSGWGAYARAGEVFPEPGHTDTSIIWVPGDFIGNSNGAVIPLNMASGRWVGGERTISHYFDLDDDATLGKPIWRRLANKRGGTSTGAGGSIYFGGSVKKLFSLTHGSSRVQTTMDVLDGTTKTWTTRTSTNGAPITAYQGGLAAHIASGLLIDICQERSDTVPVYPGIKQQFWAVDAATAAAGSHTWARLTIDDTVGWPLNKNGYTDFIGWTYCPLDGCLYATDGTHASTYLWKLTPPVGATTQAEYLAGTWVMSKVTLSSSISSRDGGGGTGPTSYPFVYNRLVWCAQAQCFLWPEEYNLAKVQAIKLP